MAENQVKRMLDEEVLFSIDYIERATAWINEHDVDEEFYNILLAREDVEDAWKELDDDQKAIARAFDRMLLGEIDWLLKEETDLPFVGERTGIERRYWWWYLHEIKEGTLELPKDLNGAA